MSASTYKIRCRSSLIAVGLLLAGCGGDGLNRSSITGEIRVDGEPLQQGSLSLIPINGTSGPSAGAPVEEGQYHIPAAGGPVPGTYRVEIKSLRKTGRQIVDEHRLPPDNMVDEVEQFIPAQYNTASILTVQVQPGKNRDVDFELKLVDESR